MPAYRLFDIFNLKVGSTQIAGADSFEVTQGFREVVANNDGYAGAAARDRTFHYADGTLRGQDIITFDDILSLFESNETQTVVAEGKIAGDEAKSGRITFNRAKLAGASLELTDGGYASTQFDIVNSAASATDGMEDEVALTEVANKSITHSTAKRGVRILSASFDPDGVASAITPLACMGLSLNVRGQVDRTAGDAEYGEIAEVSGYDVTGVLRFRDMALGTSKTVSQRLMEAVFGVLTISYQQQATPIGTPATITLSNLQFREDRASLAARKFHGNALSFGAFSQNGSTTYGLASGSNKIIAIA